MCLYVSNPFKTKLPASLTYPVNAKLISEALADVPQAAEIAISFTSWRSTAGLHENSLAYPVLSIEYSYSKATQYTPHHFEESGMSDPKWRIIVQPVTASLKHHVSELIQTQAFPKLREWLLARQNLTGTQDNQRIFVWYDETKEEVGIDEPIKTK